MRERAVLPSIDLYKETLSGILQVPVKKLTGRGVFGMVPVDVLAMKNIKPSAKLLLAAMGVDAAGCCFVSASDEVLARIAGMSRPTMIAARAELERAGLIEKAGPKERQIQPYRILHPRYASQKVDAKADHPPRDMRRRVNWVECPKCLHKRGGLLKVGYCRECNSEMKTARIARKVFQEEIVKSA